MRAREKTAEAVVAKKAGNAAGAKGRRTKYKELEEELDIGAISDSNHKRNNYGSQLVSATGQAVKPQTTLRGESMLVTRDPFDGERCTRR